MWDLKYRPLVFSDVLGQEGTTQVLQARLREGKAFDASYIFAGGHGCGKCIRGDTLVPTSRGLVPIKSLMGPNTIDPLTVQVVGTDVSPADNVSSAYSYRGGIRDTVKIKTYLGYELEGTPNHRIRVMSGQGSIEWRTLGDIQPGDHACISKRGVWGQGPDLSGFKYEPKPSDKSSVPFETPSVLNEDWGSLMGFMVGDGSCKSRGSVSISCAEPDVKVEIQRLLETLGGSFSDTPDKRRPGLPSLRCHRVQFREFLAFLGVGFVGAEGKAIPWAVLASPETVVRAFLRAYFECDGSVSGNVVEAVTKSETLSHQLQIALVSLGVVTRRYTKTLPKYGTFWRVRIKGTSVATFQEKVGFLSQRKKDQLASFVAKKHAKGRRVLSNAYDIVPHQVAHVQNFYNNLPLEQRSVKVNKLFRCRHGGIACTSRQVEAIATSFCGVPGSDHFKHLNDSGYVYDPVVAVTPSSCEVFDLNVPSGESFVANGFANHNTTIARILARAMFCQDLQKDGNPCNKCDHCKACLDETMVAFTETDAASHGTTADMRQLVEDLAYNLPGISKRIYLMDEAHRMSRDAQDVLLKPIEDKRLVAIFCTTELTKIRGTIGSRCEVHEIRKIDTDHIYERMASILGKEGVKFEEEAVRTVIDLSKGHVRDTLNKLESVAQVGPVTLEAVRDRLKLSMVAQYYEILQALGDPSKVVPLLESACDEVGPSDVATGLAEAAMNSYRHANKIYADFSMLDSKGAEALYETYGPSLLGMARYFLRNSRPSNLSLICDLVALCETGGKVVEATSAPAAAPVTIKAAGQPALQPANSTPSETPSPEVKPVETLSTPPVAAEETPSNSNGLRSDGKGSLGSSDVAALTTLDRDAIPVSHPRGSRTESTPNVRKSRTTAHRKPLTPGEFEVKLDNLRALD